MTEVLHWEHIYSWQKNAKMLFFMQNEWLNCSISQNHYDPWRSMTKRKKRIIFSALQVAFFRWNFFTHISPFFFICAVENPNYLHASWQVNQSCSFTYEWLCLNVMGWSIFFLNVRSFVRYWALTFFSLVGGWQWKREQNVERTFVYI